jgi:hypothetical protein
MTEQKTIFRRVLDALVDGRTRQAQRYVNDYVRNHPELRRPD